MLAVRVSFGPIGDAFSKTPCTAQLLRNSPLWVMVIGMAMLFIMVRSTIAS